MTRMAVMPQITDFLNASPNYSAMGGQAVKDAAMFDATQFKNASDIKRADARAEAQKEAGAAWNDAYSSMAADQRQSQLFGDIFSAVGTIGGGIASGKFNLGGNKGTNNIQGWNVATNGGGSWGQFGNTQNYGFNTSFNNYETW